MESNINATVRAMFSGYREGTSDLDRIFAEMKPPVSAAEWRELAERYTALRQQEDDLCTKADCKHPDYAGAEAELAESRVSCLVLATEALIMTTPATDIASLRLKLATYDTDFYGAEMVWADLRAEIERFLPAAGH